MRFHSTESISSIKIEAGVEEADDEEEEADHQQDAYFIKRISDLPDKREISAETPALSPPKEVSPSRETTMGLIYQLLHQRSHLMTLRVFHMRNTLFNIGSVGVLDEKFLNLPFPSSIFGPLKLATTYDF